MTDPDPQQVAPQAVADPPSVGEAWSNLGRSVSHVIRSRGIPTPTRTKTWLLAILALQAVWLGLLCTRGWFYLDDLNFMAQGAHGAPGWGYLTSPVNSHLTPGLRLVFWVLAHTSHLDYGVTIAGRLVLQAASTLLLFRLLRLVSTSEILTLVVTACYAFSPLLVPATLYLASSVNQEPAQLAALVALYGCTRQARGGRLAWAAAAGLGLLVAACFWEKTAADTAAVLVVFRLGWLTTGSIRDRLVTTVRQWRAGLMMLGPLVAFAVFFVVRGYGEGRGTFSVSDALRLIWAQWARALWPAVLGGPWHWTHVPGLYNDFAGPTTAAIVLGQVTFVAVVVLGFRRSGWSGALAWTLPASTVVLGEVLVGLGRYQNFGGYVGTDYHYVYDVAVPMALAAVIAFSPAERKVRPRSDIGLATGRRRILTVAGASLGVAVVVSSVVSGALWTVRWHQNPTRRYVQAAISSVRQAGPTVTLYDTTDPNDVESYFSTNRFLSDLTADAGVRASFDRAPPNPEIVDGSGQVVPATFLPAAEAAPRTSNAFCPSLLRGARSVSFPLNRSVGPNDYFLRISYFQRLPSSVTVTIRDGHGEVIRSRDGATLRLAATAGETITALALGSPAEVTITSRDGATNLCLSSVDIGVPVSASR